MVRTICFDQDGDPYLPIPNEVMDELGWKVGDTLDIDVDMVHGDTLLVTKLVEGA